MVRIYGLVLLAVLGAAVNNNQVPKSGFSCAGHTTGYYADVSSGCQVYHMCDGLGRQFSYTCPNATLFQQRMLICDHWYMVNCSKSEDNYAANLRIGRKMPFVDDTDSNYYRTPRPDLLAHPSQKEFDIIYRTGKAQINNNYNLVGAETKNSTGSSTDEPVYFLPSHWSTEYERATEKSKVISKKNSTSTIKGKPIVTATEVPVNYKSNFKATTPVFPKTVEISTVAPDDDLGLVPPRPSITNEVKKQKVNFESNFEATTPVFPQTVELSTVAPDDQGLVPPLPYKIIGNRQPVNFESNFQATTPVYPKTIDITSEDPADVGLLPPTNTLTNVQVPELKTDFEPPPVDVNFNPANRTEKVEPAVPSKFYQPPKFEPDYTEQKGNNVATLTNGNRPLNINDWENLRKKFLIPDYDFPLDTASRPSYDTVFSSFQASDVPSEKK